MHLEVEKVGKLKIQKPKPKCYLWFLASVCLSLSLVWSLKRNEEEKDTEHTKYTPESTHEIKDDARGVWERFYHLN